ncbi:DUF4440 domain-containing protein [Bailinhaonella thermotolerans]|uniref:Nuclear transport factor 2 family protein n=1 Tax=Bailinhaonella thermotolerans TaxID=1070861 RepID=A0A3A4AD84_9ACTN|nr:nuclear transport factor 2 family protein [Bailinhaonella thermotolerans]RJL24717.1 nuclear transport factor 2 family protein [Bailinhaonella thermotolerans]
MTVLDETGDTAAVWSVITGMYDAYVAGDRAEIDRRLHPEATIWDSVVPALIEGRADLDRVRAARPPSSGEAGLTAYDEVVRVWGDTAVASYLLRVDMLPREDGTVPPPEIDRTTAVLRRFGREWLIVHLHEDVWSS